MGINICSTVQIAKQILFQSFRSFGEFSQKLLVQEGKAIQETDLKEHFPDFLWLMRDSGNLIPTNYQGDPISITDYVKTRILVEGGSKSKKQASVKMINSIFPSIHCCQLPYPGDSMPKEPTPQFSQKIEEVLSMFSRELDPNMV